MRNGKHYLFILFITLLTSCNFVGHSKKKTITLENGIEIYENSIALKLSRMEGSGLIKETEKKADFFRYFKSTVYDILKDANFSYKLEECSSKWSVFKKDGYFITSGIAMENDKKGYLFTIVYQDAGKGVFNLTNVQIGDNNLNGEYPTNLIPNTDE